MLLLVLDIHRNILTVQSFVQCISENTDKIQIILKSNCLCVKMYAGALLLHDMKILMPDNFLQPSTVSSICSKNSRKQLLYQDSIIETYIPSCLSDHESSDNENLRTLDVTFRFLISSYNVVEDRILKNNVKLKFKDFMEKKFEKYENCHIFCTNCGSLLTDQSINFKSVRKYHEEESDSSETWFCHNHSGQCSTENSTDSLYVSDMHFYFHDSLLKSLSLSEGDKSYKCSKCFSVLSFKKKMSKPHYIGFFCDKIMLEKLETDFFSIQKYKRDIAIFAFCSIVQDLLNLIDFCDLYLQSKVDERVEVLLLRLNSQKVFQFLLHEKNIDILPCEVDFKLKEVYKVLYCICSPNSELSKKWKHDFRVEFFLISDNMMTVIKDLLQESSQYVPNNQDTIDGFSFGYLSAYASI